MSRRVTATAQREVALNVRSKACVKRRAMRHRQRRVRGAVVVVVRLGPSARHRQRSVRHARTMPRERAGKAGASECARRRARVATQLSSFFFFFFF